MGMSVVCCARARACACVNTVFAPMFVFLLLEVQLLHSWLCRYIAGHSDLTGGCLVASHALATAKGGLWGAVRQNQMLVGGGMAPFDCWLCLRGMRSLGARMRMHCANAAAVAEFLQGHPGVAKVHYPGLATHPGHAVAVRQMRGGNFGGMLSFEVT
jgi:cystathionine gamma-synthase